MGSETKLDHLQEMQTTKEKELDEHARELKELDEQCKSYSKCFALKSTSRHQERNMEPLPWGRNR